MTHLQVLVRDPRIERLWSLARWIAIAAVPVLLALLLLQPKPTLVALWYVIIPVLPASFFISPALWRGICPLATLNEWGNRLGSQRALSSRGAAVLSGVGLLLFHLMVPARRLLFNQDGLALVATVAVVAVLAVALGAVYASRSAFCNAVCPVLPVERLYGQAPLVEIERGRCSTCTVCTPRGCIDLADTKVILQTLGPSRQTWAWLLTPFGAFAAALPGFILGYNLLQDGPLGSAGRVYATTLGWSLASYLVTLAIVRVSRAGATITLLLLGAVAGGVYYWFAGPSISKALALPGAVALVIQVLGLGLVAFWLLRGLRRAVATAPRASAA